ncbi:serine hydrolase domain-containing protein [Microbacterium sp. YY-01]|uniref:serine hydrolase domain-containing protein n=1 Tax=Microbacterium sp. YY-01 TaxID=3421634 RepID=UPI003D185A53
MTTQQLEAALGRIAEWPVDNAAAAVVAANGTVLAQYGDTQRRFALASVTKPLSAFAALVAVEEGVCELDDAAGPEGSTVRHLLAHASGLDFSEDRVWARPGERRIYSNRGFDVLAHTLHERSGIPFATYMEEALFQPLGMTGSSLDGSAAAAGTSTVSDLARFVAELQQPTVVAEQTLSEATTVVFPGLDGMLPGYGTQRPNDWGLGFELRGNKTPHWTGANNSASTFGHFGQSGTFLWVDPQAQVGCVALTDRNFGAWAKPLWPELSDAVLTALS